MPYSSPEMTDFRNKGNDWKRLVELVEQYKFVRSVIYDVAGSVFPYFQLQEIRITFHGLVNSDKPDLDIRIPLAAKQQLFAFIHDSYIAQILPLAKTCGLDWDAEYITDKLTKN